MSYSDLDQSLRITQSRFWFQALFKAGVQSKSCNRYAKIQISNNINRDTSMCDDLDNPSSTRRTQEFTEYLCETWPSSVLWDDYGIDDDVVVRNNSRTYIATATHLLYCSLSLLDSPERTSMNSSPPTSFTNSSREPSKTILLNGSSFTSSKNIAKQTLLGVWTTLTDGLH